MGFKLPNGSKLSLEQLEIINLDFQRDWLIQGTPGTGKTVMAIYRSVMAADYYTGKKVLLLVYNKPLMSFLKTAVNNTCPKNVEVHTYHQWLNNIYHEYRLGAVPSNGGSFNINWDRVRNDLAWLGKQYAHIILWGLSSKVCKLI
jgi:hypothetical protein